MRATWKGHLRVGTLSVPVKLYSATRSTGPTFVQLHAVDHAPVARKLVCQKDGEEVPYDEIVRAAVHGDRYVEVGSDELQPAGSPDKSIVVRQFSEPCDIAPFQYGKPYYVVPEEGGEFAYTLLRQAFVRSKKVAIVNFVLYDRQRLGIVSVSDGIIRLQQLRYVDEIVPVSEVPTRSLPQPAPGQVATAVQLMERYATPFYLSDYRNEQADELNRLIERRAKGLKAPVRSHKTAKATDEREVMPTLKKLLDEEKRQTLPVA